MTAAHEAGVIHRDIKPANVMLTKRGDVKLVDFGVAKLSDRTELTRTGVTFGTIAYMAPEYVLGQSADPQTDVWALGVVLYEMLAGKLPFDGEHAIGMMNAIANTEPPPIRRVRPDVPEALERIVTKALQKTRANRYATTRDSSISIRSARRAAVRRDRDRGHAAEASASPWRIHRRGSGRSDGGRSRRLVGLAGQPRAGGTRVTTAGSHTDRAGKIQRRVPSGAHAYTVPVRRSRIRGGP